MEVGKVFDTERQVVHYDHLGIARLIYQLPASLCDSCARIKQRASTLSTLDAVHHPALALQDDLNFPKRAAHVHRDTLGRLEKIRKGSCATSMTPW